MPGKIVLGVLVWALLAPIPQYKRGVSAEQRDGLTYVWIPPGSFQMGCSAGDSECFSWEMRRRTMAVEGFWIGQTEVTQRAYLRVTGTNPSLYRGGSLPVDRISWNSARRYCAAIGMRLPTESEWEYAARGAETRSRYGPLDAIAWYDGNSDDRTHTAGEKAPNAFGLYDILGNLWEWVEDAYEVNKDMRILRGASFFNPARDVRLSSRLWALPETAHRDMGFRCATSRL